MKKAREWDVTRSRTNTKKDMTLKALCYDREYQMEKFPTSNYLREMLIDSLKIRGPIKISSYL